MRSSWGSSISCLVVSAAALALVAGCAGDKKARPRKVRASRASTAIKPTARRVTGRPASSPKVVAKVARKTPPPSDKDRDPFNRPKDGIKPPNKIDCQGKVALRDHGLDELVLTGVVGGGTRQLAMLRASSGKTATVHRGELLGRSCSRVKAIFNDRIVLELRRTVDDKRKVSERVLRLRVSKKG